MGQVDAKTSKTFMGPLDTCIHDCSRYCLDECLFEHQCGCCSIKIQTHHTKEDESEPEASD